MNLEFEGQYEESGLKKATFLHLTTSRLNNYLKIIVSIFIGFFFVWWFGNNLFIKKNFSLIEPYWYLITCIIICVSLTRAYTLQKISARQYLKYDFYKHPIKIIVSDEGISAASKNVSINYKWPYFSHYKISKSHVLVYSGGRQMVIIPKSFAKIHDDWKELNKLVRKKITSKKSRVIY